MEQNIDDYPADNSTTVMTSDTDVTTTEFPFFFASPDTTLKKVLPTVVVAQEYDWRNHKESIVLIFMAFIILGSIMNLLFVLSFYMTSKLEKIGNSYLLAQGFCDLAMTLIVMPLLISYINVEGEPMVNYCNLLHLFTETAVYANSFFSVLTSLGWAAFRNQKKCMKNYIAMPVKIVIPIIVLICTIVVIVGIYTSMEFDFCKREHSGNIYYRSATNFIMCVVPSIISLYISLNTFSKLGRTRSIEIFKRFYKQRHFPIAEILLLNNGLFIFCWAPYLLTVYIYPGVNKILYTFLAFLGLARSSVTATLYGLFNRYFRRAYCATFVRMLSFDFQCCKKAPQRSTRRSVPDIREIPFCELQQQFRPTGRRPIDTISVCAF